MDMKPQEVAANKGFRGPRGFRSRRFCGEKVIRDIGPQWAGEANNSGGEVETVRRDRVETLNRYNGNEGGGRGIVRNGCRFCAAATWHGRGREGVNRWYCAVYVGVCVAKGRAAERNAKIIGPLHKLEPLTVKDSPPPSRQLLRITVLKQQSVQERQLVRTRIPLQ